MSAPARVEQDSSGRWLVTIDGYVRWSGWSLDTARTIAQAHNADRTTRPFRVAQAIERVTRNERSQSCR